MGSREPEFSFGSADFSKQLMPVVIDRIAKAEPDALFVALATGNGYKKITFSQYANAINVAAYWLEHQLGKSNMDEGLAYFGAGPCDVCYAILLIAAVKAGYHVSSDIIFHFRRLQLTRPFRCFSTPHGIASMPIRTFLYCNNAIR